MTTYPSALPAVIDALVTKCAAANTTVQVLDGPATLAASLQEAVVVGVGDVPGDYRSAREEQAWASIGAVSKKAQGYVNCMVLCQSGGTDIAALRTRAFTILANIESALRADIDLDGGTVLYTGLTSIEVRQQQTTNGAVVRVPFTVTYTARI